MLGIHAQTSVANITVKCMGYDNTTNGYSFYVEC